MTADLHVVSLYRHVLGWFACIRLVYLSMRKKIMSSQTYQFQFLYCEETELQDLTYCRDSCCFLSILLLTRFLWRDQCLLVDRLEKNGKRKAALNNRRTSLLIPANSLDSFLFSWTVGRHNLPHSSCKSVSLHFSCKFHRLSFFVSTTLDGLSFAEFIEDTGWGDYSPMTSLSSIPLVR